MDELTAEAEIEAGPVESYRLFTERMGQWWPPEFSWSSADYLSDIGLRDNILYEIGPDGLRWDWGRVLTSEPGRRLVFSWQIGPDRVPVPRAEDATEVDVTFGAAKVRVAHRGWERHGPAGGQYRENFVDVWPYVLGRFADYVNGHRA